MFENPIERERRSIGAGPRCEVIVFFKAHLTLRRHHCWTEFVWKAKTAFHYCVKVISFLLSEFFFSPYNYSYIGLPQWLRKYRVCRECRRLGFDSWERVCKQWITFLQYSKFDIIICFQISALNFFENISCWITRLFFSPSTDLVSCTVWILKYCICI